MNCPNCNKPAKQKYKRVTIKYKGVKVRFSKLYYSCCVDFTTTEMDRTNHYLLNVAYYVQQGEISKTLARALAWIQTKPIRKVSNKFEKFDL